MVVLLGLLGLGLLGELGVGAGEPIPVEPEPRLPDPVLLPEPLVLPEPLLPPELLPY